ncbi:gamma-glutamylcyclotransferase family protein [Leptospira sp. GIMC2001]|uniref:gamma-glutamylcyclotransferase family protein n=1 Tax=Leptospira sp. GIMC2001 TaxID=1513297 RepID=UPI00234BEF9E|nr:gamma-glutamylcyclotransferase family protein [Leptospira sp. GIMC2001]WCL47533.1 gamma-glutamylcyclotransferase [Leptospira sp. GIMC2001]
MANKTKIFVYGTLRSNGSNHFRMKNCELIAGNVRIRNYRMYSKKDYPIISKSIEFSTIVGDIFEIENQLLTELDRYEEIGTNEYKRIWDNDNGFWIYVSPKEILGLESIPDGDWIDFFEKNSV